MVEGVLQVLIGGVSLQGPVRQNNEDAILVKPGVCVVADGMGGHLAGEVASASAIAVFDQRCSAHHGANSLPDDAEVIATFEAAQQAIERKSKADSRLRGMGTTAVALLWAQNQAVVAHVGDSRAYLLRDDRLVRLTRDHSFVEALREQPELASQFEPGTLAHIRGLILRALGAADAWEPDLMRLQLQSQDWLLLCSDGLTDALDDDELTEWLQWAESSAHLTLDQRADVIAEAAIEAGSADNVSIVLMRVTDARHAKS